MGCSIGIDFGTSNSAAAIASPAGTSLVLALDPLAEDARLFRSVLFFPADSKETLAGAEAILRYLEEGEGRFLQSPKSFLPSRSFERTEIRRRPFRIEELVALLLRVIRERAEAQLGAPIERAVFGRPAVFGADAESDELAEARLLAAAELAGFPTPIFLIEPIAAALGYEEKLEQDETVLVGDFGAGTSDFTLMRLGPTHRDKADRREDVLASGGVRIGGDRFDAAIVEHLLLPRFGAGSTYRTMTRRMPLPPWLTRKLLSWHELSLLRDRSTLEFLRKAAVDSDDPEAVRNLVRLVEENLGYHLYRAVESTKRELSTAPRAHVSFHEAGIEIEEQVTREAFERWTAPLRAQLDETVERVLEGHLPPDAVFLTGGTSKIPAIHARFVERFGEERMRAGDAFTSVVAGLGRASALS